MLRKQIVIWCVLLSNYCVYSSERPASPDLPISSVIHSRSDEAVEKYIKKHYLCNVNQYDDYAQSPLYLAVFYRYVKTTDCLLKHGAMPSYTDRYGVTPLAFARKSKESSTMIYRDEFMTIQDKNAQPAELDAIIELLEKAEADKTIRLMTIRKVYGDK